MLFVILDISVIMEYVILVLKSIRIVFHVPMELLVCNALKDSLD